MTLGHVQLPPCCTVNPNDVVCPAESAPLPLGFMVITFPEESHDGDPFHVAMIFCGLRTVTVDCQPLMLPFARMVTVPLKRSFHFWPSEYVAVQLPPPVGGGVVVVGVGVGLEVGFEVGLDVGMGVPPAFSWLSTLV